MVSPSRDVRGRCERSPTFVNKSRHCAARRLIRFNPSAWPSRIAVVGERKCTCVSAVTHPCEDRKSTRLNSSHSQISYAVFCLKKKKTKLTQLELTFLLIS